MSTGTRKIKVRGKEEVRGFDTNEESINSWPLELKSHKHMTKTVMERIIEARLKREVKARESGEGKGGGKMDLQRRNPSFPNKGVMNPGWGWREKEGKVKRREGIVGMKEEGPPITPEEGDPKLTPEQVLEFMGEKEERLPESSETKRKMGKRLRKWIGKEEKTEEEKKDVPDKETTVNEDAEDLRIEWPMVKTTKKGELDIEELARKTIRDVFRLSKNALQEVEGEAEEEGDEAMKPDEEDEAHKEMKKDLARMPPFLRELNMETEEEGLGYLMGKRKNRIKKRREFVPVYMEYQKRMLKRLREICPGTEITSLNRAILLEWISNNPFKDSIKPSFPVLYPGEESELPN